MAWKLANNENDGHVNNNPEPVRKWRLVTEDQESPKQKPSLIGSMPESIKAGLGLLMSSQKPMSESVPERMAGLGRGFTDIQEGAKQGVMQAGESLGFIPQGNSKEYTNQRNEEREFYNKTPAGKDFVANLLREGSASSPLLIAGAPAALEKGLASKMLWGAGGGLEYGGTKYLEHPEERRVEMVKDALIGGGIPGAAATGKKALEIPEMIKTLRTKINPSEIGKTIQASHDKIKQQSADIYDFVKKEAYPRGVGKVNIDENLITQSKRFLDSGPEMEDVLKKAGDGDFNAIRELQSLLGEEGAALKISSPSKSKTAFSLRSKLNDSVYDHMKEYGAEDLGKMLKEANEKYTHLHDAYYSHPSVRKIVDKYKGRIMPKNLNNLYEDSDRIKKFNEVHPEIKNAIDTEERKKEILKKMHISKSVGAKAFQGSLLGGGAAGGMALINHFLGK